MFANEQKIYNNCAVNLSHNYLIQDLRLADADQLSNYDTSVQVHKIVCTFFSISRIFNTRAHINIKCLLQMY